jgi:hypothetical protein
MFSSFYIFSTFSMNYLYSVWLQASGSWVLVGFITDKRALLLHPSSSFLELSLSEDNSSFTYIERSGLG